jgi:hypothetical protein
MQKMPWKLDECRVAGMNTPKERRVTTHTKKGPRTIPATLRLLTLTLRPLTLTLNLHNRSSALLQKKQLRGRSMSGPEDRWRSTAE